MTVWQQLIESGFVEGSFMDFRNYILSWGPFIIDCFRQERWRSRTLFFEGRTLPAPQIMMTPSGQLGATRTTGWQQESASAPWPLSSLQIGSTCGYHHGNSFFPSPQPWRLFFPPLVFPSLALVLCFNSYPSCEPLCGDSNCPDKHIYVHINVSFSMEMRHPHSCICFKPSLGLRNVCKDNWLFYRFFPYFSILVMDNFVLFLVRILLLQCAFAQ